MNRGIYSLASGMVATQQAMDVVTNNLANVNTSGFKQDQVQFNEAMQQALTNSAGAAIGTLGTGPTIQGQYTDQTQGALTSTRNPMDLAIQGKGMFAVQGPNGILYTRNGAFTTGANGDLVDTHGYPVLDTSMKPIQLRPGPMQLAEDGSISTGPDGSPYAQVGVFTGSFSKEAQGLYQSSNAAAVRTATTGTTQIKQGVLESSNVSALDSMVQMMNLGRNFDLAQKSIQSEDDMSQKLSTTLS